MDHPDGVQLRSDALEGNDYAFIPMELYRDLNEKFGHIGKEIVRKVIPTQTDGYITVIETFLVPLRLCASRSQRSTAKQIYRSRRTKLADLKYDICSKLNISGNSHYRLMSSIDEAGERWETVDDRPDLVLADIELTKNAFITYESAATSARLANAYVAPPGALYTPGVCGLSNLGNTCFMNSALQCLSNVPALMKYFLDREYIDHINRDNPLGMKGDVAQAYGELIANMWSGKTNYYTPKTLKQNVARYAPQFSGYNQQDSQEFMSFLLDGLHEDLNQVKQKPYVAKKDEDKSKTDPELAREHWEDYLKRNQSKIHEIFHGQIKSVVQCLTCHEKGRTFDPICFLSLPLPDKKKIRTFKIDYVRLDGSLKTYYIKSNEHGRMRNLVQDFCKRFQGKEAVGEQPEPMEEGENGAVQPEEQLEKEEEEEDLTKAKDYDGHQPDPNFILMAEIYNSRIYSQYKDETFLTNVLERDRVVFYQTPNSLKGANIDTILMPCVFRSTDTYRSNFGLPFYVNIPRKNCKGKDIDEALKVIRPPIDRCQQFFVCWISLEFNWQIPPVVLGGSIWYAALHSLTDHELQLQPKNENIGIDVRWNCRFWSYEYLADHRCGSERCGQIRRAGEEQTRWSRSSRRDPEQQDANTQSEETDLNLVDRLFQALHHERDPLRWWSVVLSTM